MTKTLLVLGAAVTAAIATRWIAIGMIPTARLTRRNYRGVPVATGLGVAVLVGTAAGIGLVAFVRAVAPDAPSALLALGGAIAILILGFGFGLLGLFDDLAEQEQRGWRSHIPDLVKGRITPGTLKIVGGGILAFVFGAGASSNIGWALVYAAIIALMANLFNSLDVRPGRAGKAFLLAGIPLAILVSDQQAALAAALGATAAFLPFDLRERAMLGDAGSNALGAIIGASIVASSPAEWLRLSLLGLLIVLTVVAEGPTLSAWIDRIGPLRAADQAGRVPM
jgi:UDP-N-acetylmuramyl pentapeptide phosphotransferase/UDP-N-acetylglucosamine-1-phosphate transferase